MGLRCCSLCLDPLPAVHCLHRILCVHNAREQPSDFFFSAPARISHALLPVFSEQRKYDVRVESCVLHSAELRLVSYRLFTSDYVMLTLVSLQLCDRSVLLRSRALWNRFRRRCESSITTKANGD